MSNAQVREAAVAYIGNARAATAERYITLADHGARAMSTTDLLTAMLGNYPGSAVDAARLLAVFGDLEGLLKASFLQLQTVSGIGPALAARVMAALELGRRVAMTDTRWKRALRTPEDAAALLKAEIGMSEQEHFCILLLDVRMQVLKVQTLYVGARDNIPINTGEVFKEAVRIDCDTMILGHNHPSGDPTPSPDDIGMTRKLLDAAKMLDIRIQDHIVVAGQRHRSIRGCYPSIWEV